MLKIKYFKKKHFFQKKHSIFQKIILDGKSYKIHKKKNNLYCRFNKRNKEFVIYKNLIIKNKNLQKCIYFGPIFKRTTLTKLNIIFRTIRPLNTFTKRGLLVKNQFFYKRTGRISGYV